MNRRISSWKCLFSISNDAEEYQKYLAEAEGIFRKYNGKYLALDGEPVCLEGSRDYTSTVLISFERGDSIRFNNNFALVIPVKEYKP